MDETSPANKKTDRKISLVSKVQQNEPISVNDLVQSSGLSASTLRRELRQLVEDGVLKISVGQVTLATSNEEKPFVFRQMVNIETKQRIARATLDLIQNGDTVFISGGTTTMELVRLIPHQRRLTVITNAFRLASMLIDVPGVELIVLGGVLRPGEQTMHGHLTEWGVHQFRADKLIFGTEAISLQHGITHSQLLEVSTDRALVNAATQVFVLADHTKFGKVAPAFVLSLDKVHVLVSDQELPGDIVQVLKEKNIQVILA